MIRTLLNDSYSGREARTKLLKSTKKVLITLGYALVIIISVLLVLLGYTIIKLI